MKLNPRSIPLRRTSALFLAAAGLLGAGNAFAGGRIVTVDTEDNGSTAGDGKTSLLEALNGQLDDDTIVFNLPGAGPHLIKTPLGGYPLITAGRLVINGYSQPGASPNTHDILAGNNAVIQVYLDSTDAESVGDPSIPTVHSTRLTDYSGYGDSENAILGVLGASQVQFRGLGFLSHQTSGETTDPSIYCIALIDGALDCKVQGCRFGLAPDGRTINGSSAAVAAFKYNGDTGAVFSSGLVFGTDGDGVNDVQEFNLTAGMHIALALELPGARISGNYFNVLPDGKTFVNVNDIHQSLLDAGRSGGDASVENLENGRDMTGTLIGTDGNGVSDANERNIFNTVVYDHLAEFYSGPADGVVIAGNYFGVGVDGTTPAPAPTGATPDLVALPGNGSLRLGSDFNGTSDELEGNLIVGIPGGRLVDAGKSLAIMARGNRMINCGFEVFPFKDGSNAPYAEYYANALVTPAQPGPTVTSFDSGILKGSLPEPNLGIYPLSEVDVYIVDPAASANGLVLPGTFLKSFRDNGPDDTNPAANQFSVNLGNLAIPSGSKLAIAASYSADPAGFSVAGVPLTGPLSGAVAVPDFALGATTVISGNVVLTWAGGTAPYLVQFKSSLTAPWMDLVTTSEKTAGVPLAAAAGFFRVQDGTTKTVRLFKVSLNGANQRPTPINVPGTGIGLLSLDGLNVTYQVTYQNLSSAPVAYHLHGLGTAQQAVGVLFGLVPNGTLGTSGSFSGQTTVDQATADGIVAGLTYFNIHTPANGGGEIRGQVLP